MTSIPSTALGSDIGQESVQPLYVPPSPDRSRLHSFIQRVNATRGTAFSSYLDFYNWSISQTDQFWSDVWDDTDVLGYKGSHVVDTTALPPDNPPWFAEARLNWAENMLRCRSASKTALIEVCRSYPCHAIISVPGMNCLENSRAFTLTAKTTTPAYDTCGIV